MPAGLHVAGDLTMVSNTSGVQSWVKLAETAEAGQTQVKVFGQPGWQVGDVLVLTATDFEPAHYDEVTVSAVTVTEHSISGGGTTGRCEDLPLPATKGFLKVEEDTETGLQQSTFQNQGVQHPQGWTHGQSVTE